MNVEVKARMVHITITTNVSITKRMKAKSISQQHAVSVGLPDSIGKLEGGFLEPLQKKICLVIKGPGHHGLWLHTRRKDQEDN